MALRRSRVSAFLLVLLLCAAAGQQAFAQGGKITREGVLREDREGREREAERDKPLKRKRWFMRGRIARGESSAGLLLRGYKEKMRLRALALKDMEAERSSETATSANASTPGLATDAASPGSGPAWQDLGPAPMESDPTGFQSYGKVSGRVNALAVDPGDPSGNTILVGGAYGGVWKSTNAAAADPTTVTFTPLTENEATLSIGAIAIHPTNSNIILVGTGEPNSAGDSYYGLGILRSTDGGATWTLITSANNGVRTFKGLGFSKIVFSTANPNLVVATTAATTLGVSAASGGLGAEPDSNARGIYFSTDAGATWTQATANDAGTATAPGSSSGLVFNAGNNTFYAAIRFHGIYSSTNGQTWTRLPNQPGGTLLSATACPASPVSFECPLYRAEITVRPGAAGTPHEMFLVMVDSDDGNQGIYRSADGGASWTRLSDSGFANCGEFGCGTTQGGFNLAIAAMPNGNALELFVGAVNAFRCTIAADGTCASWRNLTHVYGCSSSGAIASSSLVHPDVHAIAVVPGTQIVYFGNDGGLYRTMNGAPSDGTCSASNAVNWQNLNQRLPSFTQFVWFANHPSNAGIVLAGSQDNGSAALDPATSGANGKTWRGVNGGDGGYPAIDPTNANLWYTANTDVSIYRCNLGTGCNADLFPASPTIGNTEVGGDSGSFYTPYILDPHEPSKVIIGTCRIWRGNGDGTGWTSANALSSPFDPSVTTCTGGEPNMVSSIAAGGPRTSGQPAPVIYAGTEGGRIFVSTNATTTATFVDRTSNLNAGGFNISAIALDPAVAAGTTAYATVMGFGVGHVWKTTDAGATWSNVSGNLPDVPTNAVVVDPLNSNFVYVGTDVGVFVSRSGGNTWSEYGTGLPNVVVTSLQIFNTAETKKLRASTYGRGMWQNELATNFAAMEASPSTLSFGAVLVGTSSSSRTLALVNSGGLNVSISSVALTGPFTSSGNCVTTLAAGEQCVLQIGYVPQGTASESGSVTITHSASQTPLIVNLSGTGANFSLVRLVRPRRPGSTASAEVAVAAGRTVQLGFAVNGGAPLAQQLSFECGGLPAGASCSVLLGETSGADVQGTLLVKTTARSRLMRGAKGNRAQATPSGTHRVTLKARAGEAVRSLELELMVR